VTLPTYDLTDRFRKDLELLDAADRARFHRAVQQFIEDLASPARGFRRGLRVKGVRGADGVFELTWAPDGRATFQFGVSLQNDEPHIVWRRIGTHDIFGRP
jgi:hypothetical protein